MVFSWLVVSHYCDSQGPELPLRLGWASTIEGPVVSGTRPLDFLHIVGVHRLRRGFNFQRSHHVFQVLIFAALSSLSFVVSFPGIQPAIHNGGLMPRAACDSELMARGVCNAGTGLHSFAGSPKVDRLQIIVYEHSELALVIHRQLLHSATPSSTRLLAP